MKKTATLTIFLALALGNTTSTWAAKYGPDKQPDDALSGWNAKNPEVDAYWSAVARIFGFKDAADAYQACEKQPKKKNGMSFGACQRDVVYYLRDALPEVKQFGFTSWSAADVACRDHQMTKGPSTRLSCTSDPFQYLRK